MPRFFVCFPWLNRRPSAYAWTTTDSPILHTLFLLSLSMPMPMPQVARPFFVTKKKKTAHRQKNPNLFCVCVWLGDGCPLFFSHRCCLYSCVRMCASSLFDCPCHWCAQENNTMTAAPGRQAHPGKVRNNRASAWRKLKNS
nr:hypothetical protein [Pandoravirus aubagnensis]